MATKQKFDCTLCGHTLDVDEQTSWISGATGRIVLKNRCKSCTRKEKSAWLINARKKQTYYWKCKILREKIKYSKNSKKINARRRELYHQKKQAA